ncbi:uncharacterized protein LOC129910114 [Episyrphus balteatus]|uniref:uncharacterized protein LOC129910114 n=1 Tax=Episyrphus balteatus TaxID=286459 RepID=UPI002486ACF9|nr:uncharacterized protein LOC129910114 [Episyrphus balteatus]XP_055843355.1 uncharacterized protein LOC129910114 [Episyrphus balteatus]XP_055843356.1 uncharacterized protein LOC129910114 [Episyrphus balteatus]
MKFLLTWTLLSFCILFGCARAQGRSGSGGHGNTGQIRRETDHCWRRYDGYNKNTVPGQKSELRRPFGVLCTFKCTILLYTSFSKCEFVYDYKLSCYLLTSLPDCLSLKCTFLDFISNF